MSSLDDKTALLRESLDLCEAENDKARRLILWCAQRMPKEHLPELQKLVKGDLSIEQNESDRELLLKLLTWTEKLCEVVAADAHRKAPPPPEWFQKLHAHADQVRGLLQEVEMDVDSHPTLYEVREGKIDADAKR